MLKVYIKMSDLDRFNNDFGVEFTYIKDDEYNIEVDVKDSKHQFYRCEGKYYIKKKTC